MKRKVIILSIFLIMLLMNLLWYFFLVKGTTHYDFVLLQNYDRLISFTKQILIIELVCFILPIIFLIINKKKLVEILFSKHLVLVTYISLIILFIVSNSLLTSVSLNEVKCKIYGNSMNPTLDDGSVVTLKYTTKIKFQDIIIFEVNEKDNISYDGVANYYIKRVIGLPGDKVKWIDSKLFINGEIIEEAYLEKDLNNGTFQSTDFDGNFKYIENGKIYETDIIPNGYCFVLGDNRGVNHQGIDYSLDSRVIGLIKISNILGVIK